MQAFEILSPQVIQLQANFEEKNEICQSPNWPAKSHAKCQLDTCITDGNVGPQTKKDRTVF